MESLPLTADAIAFTEKKMDMTLGMLFDHFVSCLITLIHISGFIYLSYFLCLRRGYNQDVKEKECWRQETP